MLGSVSIVYQGMKELRLMELSSSAQDHRALSRSTRLLMQADWTPEPVPPFTTLSAKEERLGILSSTLENYLKLLPKADAAAPRRQRPNWWPQVVWVQHWMRWWWSCWVPGVDPRTWPACSHRGHIGLRCGHRHASTGLVPSGRQLIRSIHC